MMKPNISRRGSALLIVLGMLSFMVVSAVAFSILMRQGRLPSSFLRQKLISRQIVKAGLAQAMSELDKAINDNPFPGNGDVEYVDSDNNRTYRNNWRNRVYLGYDPQSGFSNTDGYPEDAVPEKTVSTFPLEGLAYIPAPLVNTVRYWARRSNAAKWKPLDYDSGRYAFTAVNVSDYLDINRVHANVMRDSSPSNRISIAYLFENEDHTGFGGDVKFDAFDEFLAQVNSSTYGRLVSLADYNLAIGSKAFGDVGFKSPFWEYIMNGGESFIPESVEASAKAQKFVTDSWYPGSETNTAALFLTDDDGQPFAGKPESVNELQKASGSKAFSDVFCKRLDMVALAALYDYVDEDVIPISLAMPTIERAPMLTGIRVSPVGLKVSFKSDEVQVPGEAEGVKDIVRTFSVDKIGDDPKIRFSACGVFPFKRKSGMAPAASYPVEVMIKMFFIDSSVEADLLPTRVKSDNEAAFSYPPGVSGNTWSELKKLNSPGEAFMTVVARGTATLQETTKTGAEGAKTFDVIGVEAAIDPVAVQGRQVYAVKIKKHKDPDTGFITEDPPVYFPEGVTDSMALQYWSGSTVKTVKQATNASGDGPALRVGYSCWVRVLDGSKTVDLVPATFADDRRLNDFDSDGMPQDFRDKICGGKEPILPIISDPVMQFNLPAFSGSGATGPDVANQGTLAVYCDDPRFNYAPEDWYKSANGDVQAEQWLGFAVGRCDGGDGRQRDILQFVSNQGYLQSMGELQFLPFINEFCNAPAERSPIEGQFFTSAKYNGDPFSARTLDNLANRDFAWKTHCAFGELADGRQDKGRNPYNWNIEATRGGAAVNPYADADLFMAALANTPYDYIVASESTDLHDPFTSADIHGGQKVCFNASSSEAQMTWENLQAVREGIVEHFRAKGKWDTSYTSDKDENWDDDWDTDGQFFGQSLPKFHDVDRKFLYSYWKECFANNQQLFLVFVRAEPTVMGNSGSGHTPAQLGARAVALVWRDPVGSLPPQGTGTKPSHRMRILFYHQFD